MPQPHVGRDQIKPQNVMNWKTLAEKWATPFYVPWQILLSGAKHESAGDPLAGGDVIKGQPTSFGLVQFKVPTGNAVYQQHQVLQDVLGFPAGHQITRDDLLDPNVNLALAAAHAYDNYRAAHDQNKKQGEYSKWALQFLAHLAGAKYLYAAAKPLYNRSIPYNWDTVRNGYLRRDFKFKNGHKHAGGDVPSTKVLKDGGTIESRMAYAQTLGWKGKKIEPPAPPPEPPPPPIPPPGPPPGPPSVAKAGFPWGAAAVVGVGLYLATRKK